jgi:hypothetical protein
VKPLPTLPLTPEDWAIFSDKLATGHWPLCAVLEFSAREADRRDAALMLRLGAVRALGECYLRIGRQSFAVPAVQVYLRKNPIWPALP